jgi:uncharacterized protein YqeY
MLDQLTDDMKAAMKARDKPRLSAIRMLRAAIKDKEIEVGHELDEAEGMAVVSRLLKQRKDSARQYTDAGRDDLAAPELVEAELLQAYLPEQLGDDDIAAIVDQAITATGASSIRDMGKVMAMAKEKAQGRADMGKLSGLVKARLN